MSQPIHALSVGTFAPALRTLSALLDKAVAHARAAGADPDSLLTARLAPDMYTLAQQIGLACLHAEAGVARLTGAPTPDLGEPAGTIATAQAQISAAVAGAEAASEAAFA